AARLEWLGDAPLREETLARAQQLGVAERLELPGTVDGAGVRAALTRSALFFGPTRADNFFVSAAEAIVSGRPVVRGATGGQGEHVREEAGALVEVQDAAAYAAALRGDGARTRPLDAQPTAATLEDAFSSSTVGEGYARGHRLSRAGDADLPVRPVVEGTAPADGRTDPRPSLLVMSFSEISRDARVL